MVWQSALEMLQRFLSAYEQAEQEPDPARRQALITFVIVGGGPTGVELAGAIAEMARHTLKDDFRVANPRQSRVMLIELSDRVLASFPLISRRKPASRSPGSASPYAPAPKWWRLLIPR